MKRILILEDEDNLCTLYKQIFMNEGYAVLTASNGAAALELLSNHPCDLAIVDIKLGAESGLEYLRQMLTIRKKMKVVIHSAYSTFKQDFQAWSADAYLMKSSQYDELISTVNRLLTEKKLS